MKASRAWGVSKTCGAFTPKNPKPQTLNPHTDGPGSADLSPQEDMVLSIKGVGSDIDTKLP